MSKEQALARLLKLEAWLDTDEEILAEMPERVRLDHEHIHREVRLAVEELSNG